MQMFMEVKMRLRHEGHEVKSPAFDHHNFTELQIFTHNKSLIQWADRIHLIWDARSSGTIFDMGMIFMAGKPIIIEYIEPKNFADGFRQYAKTCEQPIEIDRVNRIIQEQIANADGRGKVAL